MDLLADLTDAQRAAVTHTEGPLLVVAGAGSGKTRVITRRVAHLVGQGVSPGHILAITFTNKAAGEMRHRVETLLGEGASVPAWGRGPGRSRETPTISTFHSLCARLLRRFASRVGFEPSFAILDSGDQRSAVREAMLDVHVDPKAFPPPQVAHAIGQAKDRLMRPSDLLQSASGRLEEVVAKTYEVYDSLLRQRNALDFDDLLTKTVELLSDDEIRARLQDRFQYILIDEYQDTNHAQYVLATRLAEKHKNICATGDPDQSIYGWRGADIENILRFERDYPQCKVVLLENNYRSTKTICRAANELIKRNKLRKEKMLVTDNGEGSPIVLHEAPDDLLESDFVAKRVEKLVASGTPHEEIAVFYRTNALSRSIEQSLFKKGIPYVVVGALAFYERKEVKDVLAYLRVLSNPRDDASTIRVLQTPPRGIGKSTLTKLKSYAKARGLSLSEAVEQAEAVDGIPSRSRAALSEVQDVLDRLRSRATLPGVEFLVRAIVEETNYLAYLKQEYPEEDERELNVEALIAGAREFDRQAREQEARLAPAIAPRVVRERPARPEPVKPAAPVKPAEPAQAPEAAKPVEAKKPAEPKKGKTSRKKTARAPEGPSLFADPPETSAAPETPAAPGTSAAPEPAATAPAPAPVSPEPAPLPEREPELDEAEVSLEPRPGVDGFLEQVALIAEQDALEQENARGKVSLMTVHTAKGLEFDAVFLVGLEEGLFPNARALESPTGLEEERRLAYVAITRAKKKLFLTQAAWRSRFGRSEARMPSPFLFELPGDVFESGQAPREKVGVARNDLRWEPDDVDEGAGPDEGAGGEAGDEAVELADVESDRPRALARKKPLGAPAGEESQLVPDADEGSGSAPLWSRPVGGAPNANETRKLIQGLAQRVRESAPPAGEAAAKDFAPGDRVRHEHFGLGQVTAVQGSGVATRVSVRFREFGEKNLVLQYARLVKVTS